MIYPKFFQKRNSPPLNPFRRFAKQSVETKGGNYGA